MNIENKEFKESLNRLFNEFENELEITNISVSQYKNLVYGLKEIGNFVNHYVDTRDEYNLQLEANDAEFKNLNTSLNYWIKLVWEKDELIKELQSKPITIEVQVSEDFKEYFEKRLAEFKKELEPEPIKAYLVERN